MSSTTRVQFNIPDHKLAELDEMQDKLGLSTRKDLFDSATTLLQWAMREKQRGRMIAAVEEGGVQRELVMPALENIQESKFEKRLFKVAREFGISTDRVTDFIKDEDYEGALTGSGFNASIVDEEAYLALQQEYANDTHSRSSVDDTADQGDAQLDDVSRELADYLDSSGIASRGDAVDRYLGILSKVCQQKSNRFEEVEQEITGDIRKYFGKNKRELASSGTGVNPKPIPGDTPYYAATGNNTETKRDRIEKVLRLLDYDERVIQKARITI